MNSKEETLKTFVPVTSENSASEIGKNTIYERPDFAVWNFSQGIVTGGTLHTWKIWTKFERTLGLIPEAEFLDVIGTKGFPPCYSQSPLLIHFIPPLLETAGL